MRATHQTVTELKSHEVFVFGSNLGGFHGAGAAGFAFRGTSANTWRQDTHFLRAMSSPVGSPLRKGRWAIYGIGEGYQEGNEGRSYAIPTVTRPGAKRSIPLSRILTSLILLAQFAELNPQLKFYCCLSGGGFNGYSVAEFKQLYSSWLETNPPKNISIPKEYL